MAQEIERKFLVKSEAFKTEAFREIRITQGYLSSVPERVVRVRVIGEKGFLTIKGIGNKTGVSRYEWEKEIPVNDVIELLKICEPGVVDKKRYYIKSGKHIFEVDTFYGNNEGLIIAEVELASENEDFIKPSWLGKEVTGNSKFYNSSLVKNPYTKWS